MEALAAAEIRYDVLSEAGLYDRPTSLSHAPMLQLTGPAWR